MSRADARSSCRRAMALAPTAVTDRHRAGPEGPAGATANAVTSLSLDPPLMLACLDRGSRTLESSAQRRLRGQRARRRSGGARPRVRQQGPPHREVPRGRVRARRGPDPRRPSLGRVRLRELLPGATTRSPSATSPSSAPKAATRWSSSAAPTGRSTERRTGGARSPGPEPCASHHSTSSRRASSAGFGSRPSRRRCAALGPCCLVAAHLHFFTHQRPSRLKSRSAIANRGRRSRVAALEQRAAGARRAQGEEEDDQRRDGHDPRLAPDDREREARWRSSGSESKSMPSSSRSAAPARDGLGQQRDQQRQHAVEVVQVVGRLVAGEQRGSCRAGAGGPRRPARRGAGTRRRRSAGRGARRRRRRPRRRGW